MRKKSLLLIMVLSIVLSLSACTNVGYDIGSNQDFTEESSTLYEMEINIPPEVIYFSSIAKADQNGIWAVGVNENEQALWNYNIEADDWEKKTVISDLIKAKLNNVDDMELICTVSDKGEIFCAALEWNLDTYEVINASYYLVLGSHVEEIPIDTKEAIYTAYIIDDNCIILCDTSGNVYQYSIVDKKITNTYFRATDDFADHLYVSDNRVCIVTLHNFVIKDMLNVNNLDAEDEELRFMKEYNFEVEPVPRRDFCEHQDTIYCVDEFGITAYSKDDSRVLVNGDSIFLKGKNVVVMDLICIDKNYLMINYDTDAGTRLFIYKELLE